MGDKISELPEVTTLADADLIPVVASGVTSKIAKSNLSLSVGIPAVNTYADLPLPASSYADKVYRVRQTTGVWLINRRALGFYQSNGSTWEPLPGTIALSDLLDTAISVEPTDGYFLKYVTSTDKWTPSELDLSGKQDVILPADRWESMGVYVGTVEPALITYAQWAATGTGYWSWIDISDETGTSTVSVTMSGGVVMSGTFSGVRGAVVAMTGGVVIGGTFSGVGTPAGGTATESYTMTGGIVLGGTFPVAAGRVYAMTGGAVLGGTFSGVGEAVSSETTIYATTTAGKYAVVHHEIQNGAWATVRNATTGTRVDTSAAGITAAYLAEDSGQNWTFIDRMFVEFDFSSLAGKTISAAVLTVTTDDLLSPVGSPVLSAQQGTQTTLNTAAYNDFTGNTFGQTAAVTATNTEYTITINADGLAYLNTVVGSTGKICVREHSHDYVGTSPSSGNNHFANMQLPGDSSTATKLVITHN